MIRSTSGVVVTGLASLMGLGFAPGALARTVPQALPVYQQLKSLDVLFGELPSAVLVRGIDGALYGATKQGGGSDSGTVFKVNPDGTGPGVLFEGFDGSETGNFPCGLMQGTDGALYGTAQTGGSGGSGTLFRLNTDGTGFTVLLNFDGATTGYYPQARLMQGMDGALYGTAWGGGAYGYPGGTAFKLNPDGSGFTVLKNFDNSTAGSNPYAELIQGTDGTLYGTASSGGSYGFGTVFKMNPDGSGFVVLQNFDGSTTGATPYAGLIQGIDGALYGTANSGGSNGYGTAFKLNSDGTGFTVLLNFDKLTTGANPYRAGLTQATDGVLYGATERGGSNDNGTVFKLNPEGTGFAVLENFDSSTSGAYPDVGLMQGTDGALYGTASYGGRGGGGTVFKLDTNGGGFTVLLNFSTSTSGAHPVTGLTQATDGVFYGTASVGGGNGRGTLFKLNADGTDFSVLLNFDESTGSSPKSGLIQGTDGALYGTTSGGGIYGSGTVFKVNADGTGYVILQSFDSLTSGMSPGGLLQGSDGALYGSALGGSSSNGTLFKLNTDGTGFKVLLHFKVSTTGSDPAGLVQGTDGALYGTAAYGGSSYGYSSGGYGTLFKLNTDGTGVTVLLNFDSDTTGAFPLGGLIQGRDGALYGTTQQGGGGGGTVFKLNTDGTGFVVLQNLGGSATGGWPVARLVQATDGALYGTASVNGTGGYGTVFRLNTDGSGFTILQNFDDSTNGATPLAGLIQGTDGNLYGTTSAGGDFDVGTVFRLIMDCTASWSNYGAGLAGTNGVPDFTSSANPVLGTTISLAIDNSLGADTAAFLIAGLNRASIPFKQGTVLVDPFRDWLLVQPLALSAAGLSIGSAIPNDESLCGLHVDLQVLEIDSGAAQGVSLTSGLELVLGD